MAVRLRPGPKVAALLAVLALPEAAYWLGSRAAAAVPPPGDCAVLVLGFPTKKDGSPSSLQRYRVATGVDLFRAQRCDLMVLAGGSPHSPFVEAETMSRLAFEAGIPKDQLVLEPRSRNTWENIAYSLPRLEKKPRVFLVSDALHIHRAKRYWCRQRPDLCANAYPATRYLPLRLYAMKWVGLLAESWSFVRDSFRTDRQGQPATRP
ncbi:MAG: YdcF family protein [Elusimicrobia bacterium]|nr:YdcF family protein [Elusimicrobiota bacterium]